VSSWVAVVLAIAVGFGCNPGGTYVEDSRMGGADRGDTNGRSFDFVSSKPDGDEWTIRIRGSSMWVAFSNEDKSDDLGAFNLTSKELRKIWDLVDNVNLPGRRQGKLDRDNGSVVMRLREPGAGEDGRHEVYTVYVSRDTDDGDVIDLAGYLRKIIARHRKEEPNF
jgi:hypothetical protein